ncbi:MAG: phage tail protein [Myxococcaceae bacterium]|nr:phage tail protein [Myxococcaceae bacterium]
MIPGVVVGLVEQTTGDPDGLGRIRVRYPWLGAAVLSNWCRVAAVFTGNGTGAFFLPARGDEVLLAFDAGNENVPYVIGALWNGRDLPPVQGEQAQQNVRMIKTRGGSIIRIDDTADQEQIEIVDQAGNRLLLDAAKKSVTLTAAQDLTVTASGTLTLRAAQIALSSSGAAELKASEGVTIEAGGEVSVQGSVIRLG